MWRVEVVGLEKRGYGFAAEGGGGETGDGAFVGCEGRGIVVGRGVVGVVVAFGGVGLVDAGVGFDAGLVVAFWDGGCGGAVFLSVLDACFSTTFAACAFFNVPFACTSSNILLVDGVMGVGCSGVTTDWGASFFAAGVAAGATVFFSFLTSTGFAFPAGFAATFFTAALLASTAGVAPASSATTFFGRPRFLTAGASLGGGDAIVAIQLACRQHAQRV